MEKVLFLLFLNRSFGQRNNRVFEILLSEDSEEIFIPKIEFCDIPSAPNNSEYYCSHRFFLHSKCTLSCEQGFLLQKSRARFSPSTSELISYSSMSKICTKRRKFSIDSPSISSNLTDDESSGDTEDEYYWMPSSFEFDINQNLFYEVGSCLKSPCEDLPLSPSFYKNYGSLSCSAEDNITCTVSCANGMILNTIENNTETLFCDRASGNWIGSYNQTFNCVSPEEGSAEPEYKQVNYTKIEESIDEMVKIINELNQFDKESSSNDYQLSILMVILWICIFAI
ncbi:Oidioi.mRNA.OKI2018_I69.chr2.g7092.t1.cds [Oikopleura dioica]|uniref:Oidioi.mRNA.OKI2018_I69.chr2.g7092.t1.cds n=1 Tax=Oikopleura dioica TaxID=34765 RepID=A0ABN7T522_OIKDI|nr:Oidioi.mRNA.OKI2018_I69.chr2.g7092.t1.cds [Oikopleura dioica]